MYYNTSGKYYNGTHHAQCTITIVCAKYYNITEPRYHTQCLCGSYHRLYYNPMYYYWSQNVFQNISHTIMLSSSLRRQKASTRRFIRCRRTNKLSLTSSSRRTWKRGTFDHQSHLWHLPSSLSRRRMEVSDRYKTTGSWTRWPSRIVTLCPWSPSSWTGWKIPGTLPNLTFDGDIIMSVSRKETSTRLPLLPTEDCSNPRLCSSGLQTRPRRSRTWWMTSSLI